MKIGAARALVLCDEAGFGGPRQVQIPMFGESGQTTSPTDFELTSSHRLHEDPL